MPGAIFNPIFCWWGCVPSLLFHLRPLPLFIFCSLCHLNSCSWLNNTFHMSIGRKLTYFSVYNLESLTACSSPLHQKIVHRHRFGQPEGLFGTWNQKQGAFIKRYPFWNWKQLYPFAVAWMAVCPVLTSVVLVPGVASYDIGGGSVSSSQ